MRVRSPSKWSSGFTLVELLVVIAIIATLMAMLLPAVQQVRTAANRTYSQNNLHQVGLAMHGYHDAFGRFPTANTTFPYNVSAFTEILPFLEQDPIAQRYDKSLAPTDPVNLAVTTIPVPTLVDPGMQLPPLLQSTAYASYAVCIGDNFCWGAGPDTGVIIRADPDFMGNSQIGVTMVSITDGTSSTILAGEMGYQLKNYFFSSGPNKGKLRGGNTQWAWGYASYSFASTQVMFNTMTHSPDLTTSGLTAFRSDYQGGCHFLFADGSVHFLVEGMDPATYRALGTRAGNEVLQEY